MSNILLEVERSIGELREVRADRDALRRAQAVLQQARQLWRSIDPVEQGQLLPAARRLGEMLNRAALSVGTHSCEELADSLLGLLGLGGFRVGQREAVVAALGGRDCLVVMPTGAGKSLCYQLPALAGRGLVVVVSPLIALMADQCRALTARGVSAVMVCSGMGDGHNDRALADIASGRAVLVFASPERFGSVVFRRVLARRRIALFAVDEAHCMAEWGHDFRPDYLRLGAVIRELGRPCVMAATATATPQVIREIALRLGLRDWVQINSGFDRPNLTFDVLSIQGRGTLERKRRMLLRVLGERDCLPAIVYCGTRLDTERVCELLGGLGFGVVGYHAGMSGPERTASQQAFMSGQAQVVVATNAFGMGVDKADVRTVVHWAIPRSLEAYYQEAGRAGRDGRPAKALLLAARQDLARLVRFNNQRDIDVEDVDRYVRGLSSQAHNGVVECELPGEGERILLGVAERAGALRISSSTGTTLRLTIRGSVNLQAAARAIQSAQERGWEAYRSIERFVTTRECRRAEILDFFGDAQTPKPFVRCCDTCEGELGDLVRPSVDLRQLEQLEHWRAEQAGDRPVFMIATDTALQQILRRRPRDSTELLQISGIGQFFCDRYGESLLSTLARMQDGTPDTVQQCDAAVAA